MNINKIEQRIEKLLADKNPADIAISREAIAILLEFCDMPNEGFLSSVLLSHLQYKVTEKCGFKDFQNSLRCIVLPESDPNNLTLRQKALIGLAPEHQRVTAMLLTIKEYLNEQTKTTNSF